MKYNQSILIFMYVCIMMQSLSAMELSSEFIDLPKIKVIKKLSDASHDSTSFYGAYYSGPKTIIVMNKEEHCLAINNQGEKIQEISHGYRSQFVKPIIYRKLGVKQDGKSVLVVRRKDIAICNINTDEKKLITEKSVHSVCFGAGALGNNHIFTLSGNNNGGFLTKYNEKGEFIQELTTCRPQDINFTSYEDAYKSIMCVMERDDTVGHIFKLYNASTLDLKKMYKGFDLVGMHGIEFDIPCQMSDDGIVILAERKKNPGDENKLFIFDVTDQHELRFKRSISCKANVFCGISMYSKRIMLAVFDLIEIGFMNNKKIIRYYDLETGKYLHESLMDNAGCISSISVCPNGKTIIITTQFGGDLCYKDLSDISYKNVGCTIYEVPDCIADKHIHQMGPRIWFWVNEVCEKMQAACNQTIPTELKQIIAYLAYKS